VFPFKASQINFVPLELKKFEFKLRVSILGYSTSPEDKESAPSKVKLL